MKDKFLHNMEVAKAHLSNFPDDSTEWKFWKFQYDQSFYLYRLSLKD